MQFKCQEAADSTFYSRVRSSILLSFQQKLSQLMNSISSISANVSHRISRFTENAETAMERYCSQQVDYEVNIQLFSQWT
jgi:hypothetical protein